MLQSSLSQLLSLIATQQDYERSLHNLQQSYDLTSIDPTSHILLCRFMLKIDARRQQALHCLQELSSDDSSPLASREASRRYEEATRKYALEQYLTLRSHAVSLLYDDAPRSQALNMLKAAERFAVDSSSKQDLVQLQAEGRYWQALDLGDKARASGQLNVAKRYYQQACAQLPQDCGLALIALADIAKMQNRLPQALHYLTRAIHSPSLSAAYRAELKVTQQRWQVSILLEQVRQLPPQHSKRSALLTKLSALVQNVWDRYALAQLLIEDARAAEALALFDNQHDTQTRYPHALILVKLDKIPEALQLLQEATDKDSIALKAKLQRQLAYQQASSLYAAGKSQEAVAKLLPFEPDLEPYMRYLLADSAAAAQRFRLSTQQYRKLATDDDYGPRAQLQLIILSMQQGISYAKIKPQLLDLTSEQALERLSSDDIRTLAAALHRVDEPQTALQVYADKIKLFETKVQSRDQDMPAAEDLVLLYRDYGLALADAGKPQLGMSYFKSGLKTACLYQGNLTDDAAFTYSLRTPTQTSAVQQAAAVPEWLSFSLKSQASALYQQQNISLTGGTTFSRDSGESGYSDLSALTSTLQLSFPVKRGRVSLIADHVYLDSGSLSPQSYDSKFGQTYASGSHDGAQHDMGISGALAYADAKWSWDIGTAPQGFVIDDDILGGLAYKFDLETFSLEPAIYRRPVTSSQLSFAGQCSAGICFGAVRRNGVAVNFSSDAGGHHGIWAQLAYEYYTGRRVADNDAIKAMSGWYERLINQNDRELRWGLSAMYWHFKRDLSGYTIGQGGYYSPQHYLSFGPNTVYRRRSENFVWNAEAGLSLSYAITKDSPRYPLSYLAPHLPDRDATESGDRSLGVSGRLRLLALWRLSAQLQLGGHATYQHADGYTPLYAGIFFNYTFSPWLGDLPLAIEPPLAFTER